MRLTWLGWAGVELEADGATLVIDALDDAAAVFAPLGPDATENVPQVVPPSEASAVAGLVTHLHRDHADAAALTRALRPAAPVLEPPMSGGSAKDGLALAQANAELAASGLERRQFAPWETIRLDPFTITALPAVDGIGDPQVAWLVEAGGVRVLHLGDTVWHGHWWRMAAEGPFDAVPVPVNGAKLSFPHRQPASPLPGALTPEQAALAAQILGAKLAIPIHAEGYDVPGVYEPVRDAANAFVREAEQRGVNARTVPLGEAVELS